MWFCEYNKPAVGCWFFYRELVNNLDLETLLNQAYILISKVGMSYSDVKLTTLQERILFLQQYKREMDEIERRSKV